MLREFKTFVSQGNVLEAAVGLVLALAFKAVVDSVVNGIIMPLVGLITSGYDLNAFKIVLRPAAKGQPESALLLGTVVQTAITFILIAFVLFLIVKAFNRTRSLAKAKQARLEAEVKAEAEPPAPSPELQVLTDIRALLMNKDKHTL